MGAVGSGHARHGHTPSELFMRSGKDPLGGFDLLHNKDAVQLRKDARACLDGWDEAQLRDFEMRYYLIVCLPSIS